MTTYQDVPLDFDAVSEPIAGETAAVVNSVATDLFGSWEWDEFVHAVHWAADLLPVVGEVDPNVVRAALTSGAGELTINPRRLSAFYSRAVAQGLLEFSHWGMNTDVKGHNRGKPAKIYRLVWQAAA